MNIKTDKEIYLSPDLEQVTIDMTSICNISEYTGGHEGIGEEDF